MGHKKGAAIARDPRSEKKSGCFLSFALAPDVAIVTRLARIIWLRCGLASADIGVAIAIIGIVNLETVAIAEVKLHSAIGVVDGKRFVVAFELDLVIAGLEIDNGVIAFAGFEDEEISAIAAIEHIIARTAIDGVATLQAILTIIAARMAIIVASGSGRFRIAAAIGLGFGFTTA